jgi:hypothetical protein
VESRILLDGFNVVEPAAEVDELKGALDAVNTAEFPNVVQPRHFEWKLQGKVDGMDYEFPPNSFTILRFRVAATN